jgi:hypothetical protein
MGGHSRIGKGPTSLAQRTVLRCWDGNAAAAAVAVARNETGQPEREKEEHGNNAASDRHRAFLGGGGKSIDPKKIVGGSPRAKV